MVNGIRGHPGLEGDTLDVGNRPYPESELFGLGLEDNPVAGSDPRDFLFVDDEGAGHQLDLVAQQIHRHHAGQEHQILIDALAERHRESALLEFLAALGCPVHWLLVAARIIERQLTARKPIRVRAVEHHPKAVDAKRRLADGHRRPTTRCRIEIDPPRAFAVSQVFHAVKPGEVNQQRDGEKSAKKTPWNVRLLPLHPCRPFRLAKPMSSYG